MDLQFTEQSVQDNTEHQQLGGDQNTLEIGLCLSMSIGWDIMTNNSPLEI